MVLASALFSIGATALAQEAAPAPSRGAIEVGLRLGVGLPLGHEGETAGDTTNDKLSSDLEAIIPIALDAGYRINPNVYVGLLFQYGFGIVNTDDTSGCSGAGVSCSGSNLVSASTFTFISPRVSRSTLGWVWALATNGCSWT